MIAVERRKDMDRESISKYDNFEALLKRWAIWGPREFLMHPLRRRVCAPIDSLL